MAKSYKVTFYQKFDKGAYDLAPFTLNRQYTIEGVPPLPQTKIFKARDSIVQLLDFESFLIEHEMEETAWGRVDNSVFQSYIRKEFIRGYQSETNKLLLLSGKKKFVLDFCKKAKSLDVHLQTLKIDMGALLLKLPHVKGVWFSFKNGLIRASALMGANIETTTDFKKFSTQGDISTLSFHYDFVGTTHPIMIVSDGTIVLQGNYSQISDEIELVLEINKNLISDISEIISLDTNT